jgi:hypothetical protein
MKKLAFILLFALSSMPLRAQFGCTCLPEGIYFTTQEQIDNFQVDYPGCDKIVGDVTISGFNITNLNGLIVLNSIGGCFKIGDFNNNSGNPVLTSLTGLGNLTSIGDYLYIFDNALLTSLTGMENVASIGGGLWIHDNTALTSLIGLEGLTSIGGMIYIYGNTTLTSLTGLDNLTSIGGGIGIVGNSALTSLIGLDNIDAGSISDLTIHINNSLSTCAVQCICDYLASPNGTIDIFGNATGCSSPEEVELACETVGVGQLAVDSWQLAVIVYPNPASSLITVEADELLTNCTFTIYNLHGQEVLRQRITQETTVLDISRLPPGIYFYRISNIDNRQSATGKLVKW